MTDSSMFPPVLTKPPPDHKCTSMCGLYLHECNSCGNNCATVYGVECPYCREIKGEKNDRWFDVTGTFNYEGYQREV